MATPRARPRQSNAFDAMPPPPSSPGKLSAVLRAEQAHLEAEIRDLRTRNAALEDELREAAALASASGDLSALQADLERAQQEAADFRHQLASAQIDATSATDLATELAASESQIKADLAAKERELLDLQREMKVAEERATGELEAGMEAKRREVAAIRERLEEAQRGWSDQSALVEELSAAGTAAISLYEGKVAAAEMQRDELEDRVRHLEEKVRKAAEEKAKAEAESANAAPTSPNLGQSAAEIDNETLNAQIKHLQNKVFNLEEALEESKGQLESDSEAWKTRLAKSKEAEKALQEQLKEGKSTIMRLNTEANGAKTRIGELEGALKENQGALETLRAEIEGLRADAAEASSLRAALAKAGETEKALADHKEEVSELKERLKTLQSEEQDLATYHDQVATLEAEIASVCPSLNPGLMAATEITESQRHGTAQSPGLASLGQIFGGRTRARSRSSATPPLDRIARRRREQNARISLSHQGAYGGECDFARSNQAAGRGSVAPEGGDQIARGGCASRAGWRSRRKGARGCSRGNQNAGANHQRCTSSLLRVGLTGSWSEKCQNSNLSSRARSTIKTISRTRLQPSRRTWIGCVVAVWADLRMALPAVGQLPRRAAVYSRARRRGASCAKARTI